MVKQQLFFLAVVLLCVGCSNTQPPSSTTQPVQTVQKVHWKDSVELYRQQARSGSGEAYLKLARCYYEGRGVRRDYLTMLAMAEQASLLTTTTVSKFMSTLPPAADYRLIWAGMEAALVCDDVVAYDCIMQLEHMDVSEARIIRIIRAHDDPTRQEVMWTIYHNVDAESSPLELALACIGAADAGDYQYADTTLLRLAESSPALWVSLGNLHAHHGPARNDSLAAVYYAKADEYALLNNIQRHWLDEYHYYEKTKTEMKKENVW